MNVFQWHILSVKIIGDPEDPSFVEAECLILNPETSKISPWENEISLPSGCCIMQISCPL